MHTLTLISSVKTATPGLWVAKARAGMQTLLRNHRVWRQRQDLLRLNASQLDDIGLSRDQALAEAARPIREVPANWRV